MGSIFQFFFLKVGFAKSTFANPSNLKKSNKTIDYKTLKGKPKNLH